MTQRGVVQFDWEQPGDADAQVRAAISAFERTSFDRLSRRLAELATPILTASELPSDPERAYVVRPDGTWMLLDERGDLEAEGDSDLLPLDQAVLRLGHEPDSPQGYAARVLCTLSQARQQLEDGHLDDAMALAFGAGELVNEAAMKGAFEPDVLVGEKVRAGGRRAHEQTYGTDEEKQAERADYLAAFDQEIAQRAGKMKAYASVAKRFGVSEVTIRRAVSKRSTER
jgi:hypothetical protein